MQTATDMSPSAPLEAPVTDYNEIWERLRGAPLWTKELARFARKANRAILRYHQIPGVHSWQRGRCFIDLTLVQEHGRHSAGSSESRMSVRIAGTIRGGRGSITATDGDGLTQYVRGPANDYLPTSGTWVLHLFPGQNTHATSCLAMIPTGAAVHLDVRLDWHTTSRLAAHGLHADVLEANVTKGRRHLRLELDHEVGPHDRGRFGIPY